MIKLFAHRGFTAQNIAQNSVASLDNSIKNGFSAIEFDIWLYEDSLVIKHDKPIASEIKNLPNFADYLVYKNDLEYWIDFKNLNLENHQIFLSKIKFFIEKFAIDYRKIIFAPYITDYQLATEIFIKFHEIFSKNIAQKINLAAVFDQSCKPDELLKIRDSNLVNFYSVDFKLIDKNFLNHISESQILAWTVNDINEMQRLVNLGINNFATDKITPKMLSNFD